MLSDGIDGNTHLLEREVLPIPEDDNLWIEDSNRGETCDVRD